MTFVKQLDEAVDVTLVDFYSTINDGHFTPNNNTTALRAPPQPALAACGFDAVARGRRGLCGASAVVRLGSTSTGHLGPRRRAGAEKCNRSIASDGRST